MAKLDIYQIGEMEICVVSGVPMPDRTRCDYVALGRDGLADIFCRIRADRALARSRMAREAACRP